MNINDRDKEMIMNSRDEQEPASGTCPTCGQQATAEQFRLAEDLRRLSYLKERDRARVAAAERGELDPWLAQLTVEHAGRGGEKWMVDVAVDLIYRGALEAIDVAGKLLAEDGLTVAELAERMGWKHGDIRRAVADLAAGGWVTVEEASAERGLQSDRVWVVDPCWR